jgi:hypothetical protein
MTRPIRCLPLVGLFLLSACEAGELPDANPPATDGGVRLDGGQQQDGGTQLTDGGGQPSDGGRLDTSAAGLTAFVKSGAYKSWKAEPAVHRSAGPHGGNVRTYVNDVFYASLKAGNATHPQGSITVKELYGSSTTNVTGHAVDVKDEATGEWVFYEGFGPDYTSPYYYRGISNFCAGCHQRDNNDYMLTPASAFP